MKFTFNYIELCKSSDKQAHYYVSEAKRSGMHVCEVNNKYYALVINDLTYRAPDVQFKSIGNGTYIFKD